MVVVATRRQYGPDPQQWVEFARPDVDGSVPLVVHLHGGFWRAEYALDHARPMCAGYRRHGLATLNVEYRRVGHEGGGWPGTFRDVRAALDLVPELVAAHDLDRVVVSGHSAGGHLALWVAGVTSVPLAGVVAIGAVTDLVAADRARLSDGGTAARDLLGAAPDDAPDRWASASPIEQVPLDVPVRLVHGRDDTAVPIDQAHAYAAAARAAGGDADVVEVAADHFAVLDPSTPSFAAVVDAIRELVGVPTESMTEPRPRPALPHTTAPATEPTE